MTHKKRTRGRAAANTQLGAVQLDVLHWLRTRERIIKNEGGRALDYFAGTSPGWPDHLQAKSPDDAQRQFELFQRFGVPWRKVHLEINRSPSQVSEARRTLAKRELIRPRIIGGRTTHATITALGMQAVAYYPFPSERAVREDFYREKEELLGPRATWSQETEATIAEAWRRTLDLLRAYAEDGATYKLSTRR